MTPASNTPSVPFYDGQPRSSDPDAPRGVADAAWCQTPSAPSLTASSREAASKDQDVGQPAWPTIVQLQEAIRLLDNALVQWMLDRPSPANMRPHREALWLLQEELSRLRGEKRLIGA